MGRRLAPGRFEPTPKDIGRRVRYHLPVVLRGNRRRKEWVREGWLSSFNAEHAFLDFGDHYDGVSMVSRDLVEWADVEA